MTERRREFLFLAAVLGALAAVQSIHITRPFLRHHESVGTEVGKHARNHLKFGLSRTFGLKLDVSGPSLDPYGDYRRYFYANHPPLPVLLMAGSFAMFGVGEVPYRATLIIFSIVAVILFRCVARHLVPSPFDRVATTVFAFLPAFTFYSIVTCLQVTALMGILSALLFYVKWRDSGHPLHYAGIVVSSGLATLCAWSGYYVALVLLVSHLRKGERGNRGILALVAFNVGFFALYLAWLWGAGPADLDPIRKLLGAAVDRSSWSGISLLAYIGGELRKLSIVLTVPALVISVSWAVSLFRIAPDRNDRLIAALVLLGLDEAVFARLAAGHEYYNYFLIVPVALGTGAALARLAAWFERSGRPRFRLAACAAGLLILAQSAWVLHRRLTTEGGYEFYYKLGTALEGATRPQDRVFILTHNSTFYTPFYGDRYALYYERASAELVPENSGGRRGGVTEADILGLLLTNPDRFDVAVTAEKSTVVSHVRWFQGMDDRTLEEFGVETLRTPRRELLEQLCGRPREYGGFLFWNLPRR